MPVSRHSGSPSTAHPEEVDRRALRHRHDGERAGQQVEAVVGEPHSKTKRNERVGELQSRLRTGPRRRARPAESLQRPRRRGLLGSSTETDEEHRRERGRFRAPAHRAHERALDGRSRRGHREARSAAREREQHRQHGDIAPVGQAADAGTALDLEQFRAGTRNASATLSCGQACTQSRQNVQSRLPTLAGRNSPSSQPRCHGAVSGDRPLMQSNVRQVRQVSGWRTCTSSGDTVDATKLNCPIGQRYLQNVAPVKTRSTSNAAPK